MLLEDLSYIFIYMAIEWCIALHVSVFVNPLKT